MFFKDAQRNDGARVNCEIKITLHLISSHNEKKVKKNTCLLLAFFIFNIGLVNKANAAAYTVGTAGNYTTLKLAFDAVNAGTITGAITFNVISSITEATPGAGLPNMSLNASGVGSANYSSILIQPSGGAWTISGAAISNTAWGFMDIKGSNVTIDGLNTGGNSLVIANTQLNTAFTIRFSTGVSNNIIRNCTIQGSTRTAGVINLATGNNHDITITNCDITLSGANVPISGIISTAGNYNIRVTNNTIHDYFRLATNSYGIYVTDAGAGTLPGGYSWVVTGNKFYQTATRTTGGNTGADYGGIYFDQPTTTTATSYDIENNIVGYAASNGTGTMTYDASANDNANYGAAFVGIVVHNLQDGATATVKGNTIAGISFKTSTILGTPYVSSGALMLNWFDIPPGIFTGIYVDVMGTANTATVNIGSCDNPNIVGGAAGITVTINNTNAGTGAGIYVGGIFAGGSLTNFSGGIINVTNNVVSNMTTALTTAATDGITLTGITYAGLSNSYMYGDVTRNHVYNLTNTTNTSPQSKGIEIGSDFFGGSVHVSDAAYPVNVANNMVTLVPANSETVFGISHNLPWTSGSYVNYYYNSIYIGGSGAGTTSAFNRVSGDMATAVKLKDNIFYNVRTNATDYAIRNLKNPGTTGWASGASDYNILYSGGANLGKWTATDKTTLALWRAAGGAGYADVSSFSVVVTFSSTATGDLHLTSDLSVSYPGTVIGGFTTDIDAGTRNNPPDMGADEFGSVGSPQCVFILPVELISFSGRNEEGKNILNWQTASEINNDNFIIERSADGHSWTGIGKIQGAGNSSTIHNYDFVDESPLSLGRGVGGEVYYRLKQTDFDGRYEYFGPIAIQCSQQEEWSLLLQNIPANEELMSTLFIPENEKLTVDIIDLQGRILYAEPLSAVKGSNFFTIDLSAYTPGMYFIRVYTAQKSLQKKFIRK